MQHILEIVVFTCLISGSFSRLTETCPPDPCPGGVAVRGYCYRLFNLKSSWDDAQQFCRDFQRDDMIGGSLAGVYSSTHQTALRNYLSTAGGQGNPFTGDIWLGGVLQDPEKFTNLAQRMWRWVSDCESCSIEELMTETAVDQQGCFSDWGDPDVPNVITLGGAIINATCQSACQDLGFRFAALQTPAAPGPRDTCACGNNYGRRGVNSAWGCFIPCQDDPTQLCGGVNRQLIFNIGGSYANWHGNPVREPISTFLMCGALNMASNPPGVQSISCTEVNRFVCGLSLSQCDFCPCGATCFNVTERNLCVYVPTNPATWFNARQHCVDRGGDLLVLDNEQLHIEVTDLLRDKVPELLVGNSFIGLYKDNYLWSDNNGGTMMQYSDFTPGSPEEDISKECIYMDRGAGSLYQWNTDECTEEKSFLCQFPLSAHQQAELRRDSGAMSFILQKHVP